MLKKIGLFSAVLAITILIGAGCDKPKNNTTTPTNTTTPLTLDAENNDTLILTVEKAGAGTVELKWQAGKDLGTKDGFRLFHSAKNLPNPGAFWYWMNGETNSATWGEIPSGKRFFRACVWQNDECGTMSNEVELEVE